MKTFRLPTASGAPFGTLLLAGLALALAAPEHADARGRFGGGRSVGLSRTISVPEPHLVRPVALEHTLHRPVESRLYGQPAGSTSALHDLAAGAAMLARRAELESARQRIRDAHLNEPRDAHAALPAGDAPATPPAADHHAPAAAPAAALPATRAPRVADPDFGKTTHHAIVADPCEIKPVMSDNDYRACGANPPSLPALGPYR